VSVDPLQFDYPQLTPFNYAGNKPATHIDIDGLQSTGDEKHNTFSDQSYIINQNEEGEVISVSIYKTNIVLNENGEIISGDIDYEEHSSLYSLENSGLLNSLDKDVRDSLLKELYSINSLLDLQRKEFVTLSSDKESDRKSQNDKLSVGLNIADRAMDILENTARATWGKYKNAKGAVVSLKELKGWKGSFSSQGNVSKFRNVKYLSNHAKDAIKYAKYMKYGGYVTSGLGLGYDIYLSSTGQQGWDKTGVNAFFTCVGIWGGPIGIAVSFVYFGVDAAVDGGWSTVGTEVFNRNMDIHNNNIRQGVMGAPHLFGK
jgi:hypothetical protein